MGDVTRLPVWAQARIKHLEQQLEQRDAKIDQLSAKHEGSNVQVSGYSIYPDWSLPPNSEVCFFIGAQRRRYVDAITVRHDNNRPRSLRVAASGGYLVVKPVAANVIDMTMEDF